MADGEQAEARRADAGGWVVTLAAWGVALTLIVALAGAAALGVQGLAGVGARVGAKVGDVSDRVRDALASALPDVSLRLPEPETRWTTPGEVYPIHGGVDLTRMFEDGDLPDKPDAAEAAGSSAGTDPSWIDRPAGEYPYAAMREAVGAGSAVMTCRVRPDGRIGACSVVEDPPGVGFGRASLAAMYDARLTPKRVDGVPVEGNIRFTIRYLLQ